MHRRAVAIVAAFLVAAGAGVVVAATQHDSKPVPRGEKPGRPDALTVNGVRAPVGTNPDDVSFAWHVVDTRPDAQQRGYRLLVGDARSLATRSSTVVWDTNDRHSAQQAFVAYRGPRLEPDTQYWWTVATRDGAGHVGEFAEPQPFVTGLRGNQWHGQWVRPGPTNPGAEEYTYIRKDVPLASSPITRATAYIGAAHQYELWVNGTYAGIGPSFAYPDSQYYQATDVTRLLRSGTNTIGVLHHWAGAGQGRPQSAPGLIVQLTVVHRDGRREVFGTDGTWREHAAEWKPALPRNSEGNFIEHVDGRLAPQGWSRPGFDAHAWRPVAVIGPPGTSPFTRLVAQRTRIVEHPQRPHSAKTLPSGAVVVDYGAVIAARPTVAFRHGVAGRVVAMHVGFALEPDGRVSNTHAIQGTDLSFAYTERAGAQTFEPFLYLGFRYLEIDAPGEPLAASQLVALVRNAAMPNDAPATFSSSSPTLDAVFAMLGHSALSVSQEQFVDTPTREKGQFLGDSFNDSLAVMGAFGDQNLTSQALADFAQSQRRYWPDGDLNAVYPNGDGARMILDFTERYPEWVWQYYANTGDRATLAHLYPVVKRVADFVWSEVDPATGLLTPPPNGDNNTYGLVDWPPQMRYGYDTNTRVRTTSAILAADVFERTAQMADLLSIRDDTSNARARRTTIVAGINRHLTRRDGIYLDGIAADGTPSTHASQQANAFALTFGIVPSAHIAAVGAYVAGLGISTGPMDGLQFLQGLHAAHRDADIVRVLTDTKDPGWAHIIAAGGTFSWEAWTLFDVQGDSMSHGWGSSALVAFQQVLLGVSSTSAPTSAHGPTFDVRPPPPNVPNVAGRIPTIAGPILVRWHRASGRTTLRLTLPPNVSAHVYLPGRQLMLGAGHHVLSSRGT
ncbi:MAG: alpha-L-rhamnosidase domain protein [Actinomycetia bacterium]|nr:alpha-L-rhamnosidase domain protein [Actinomycetes bacterium]